MLSRWAFIAVISLIVFLITESCGPSRFVVPLRRGDHAVSASFGGPVIEIPEVGNRPIPMSSITYGHGISDNLTAYGSLFTTAAIFGTIQLDAGVTRRLWMNPKGNTGITVSPGLNFAMDIFEFNTKLWPQLDFNYYWKYSKHYRAQEDFLTSKVFTHNFIYAGLGSWFELSRTKAHEQDQEVRMLPIIQLGHDLTWKRWILKTEVKLIGFNHRNENIVVDYKSVFGDFGATGVYIGITRRF